MADSKPKSEEQVSTDESEHKLESSAVDSTSATAAINASKSSRKRTKTGCLTCRRRRIKCGEERPICNNCIKSKRNCEGYNPRAIFKEPGAELTSMLGNGYHQELESPIYSANHGQPVLHHSFDPASFQMQQANAPYTALAPRPSIFNGQQYPTPLLPNTSDLGQGQAQLPSLQHYSTNMGTVGPHDSPLPLVTDQPGYPQYINSPIAGSHLYSNHGLEPQIGAQVTGVTSHPLYPSNQLPQQQRPLPAFDPRTAGSALPHINTRRTSEVRLTSSNGNGSSRRSVSADARHEPETEDDMDFEMSAMESANVKESQGQNVGLLIAVKATQRQQPRRPPVHSSSTSSLSTYVPSASASPLLNPETARIFCHFVTMTGPLLSIQERLVPNPALMFSQNQVPRRRQCIWTYTMPLLALESPALLQAILAVSCLHIAKLKGESVLPSLKHYHMALRRVARCVSLPSKRNGVDILGATLLLGYYEVASQEHNKWNSHLLGARQLLVETDFLGTTRRLQKMKNENIVRKSFSITAGSDLSNGSDGATMTREQAADEYLGPNRDIDESFLGLVAGQRPKFAHDRISASQTGEIAEVEAIQASLTSTEIDDFDLRCDLYWWYLKQDTIQSLISTNELLLNFEKWTDVPPRAPMDRPNATYGTYDHLILIMGRLASFASKDLARKRRAGAASSGPWKLPSGVDVSSLGPPSSSEKYGKLVDLPGKTVQPNGSQMVDAQNRQMQMQMQGPPMAGMIPAPPAAQMPRGFAPEEGASPASTQDDQDLEVSTAQAEEEWVAIKEALAAFEGSLGEGFQPLPQESHPIVTTPFGTAVFYASPAIALIWQWYHTALIIHQRVHPSMPPAAMIAAGISARQTAHSAIQIGRISAGVECLAPGVRDLVVDSAAPDIALGLFFAAIQYQDPAQRGWTVAKLRSMTDRVGWGTGDTIASGCERAWERAALMGRGPPYIRAMNPWAKDDRLAGRPFDPNNPIKDENDRRYMLTNPGARVHWALGVLGLENDVKNLTV